MPRLEVCFPIRVIALPGMPHLPVEYCDVLACRGNEPTTVSCGGPTRFHFALRPRANRPWSGWPGKNRRSLSQYIEPALEAHVEAARGKSRRQRADAILMHKFAQRLF